MDCLSDDSLQRLSSGALSGAELDAAIGHLDGCADCRRLAAALAQGDAPAEPSPGLPPPTLGRYVLLDLVGSGAMGVVYRAFDPVLDRKVALKVLRQAAPGAAPLLDEAQAMARLAHPNIVAVHDVGTFPEGVFLAMELVDGPTARAWLAARTRSSQETIALYAQAGRGLAAAHAAGLVHRDFKPENVLVGSDGRARVTDFGLAARGAARGAAGTPRYMAPEQLAGGETDARSDQFGFCVSLWEALEGERPFEGATSAEVLAAIARGPKRPAKVPARLLPALRRGLAEDPAARFPSMSELLAVLEADPGQMRRRLVAGAGAVGLLAALLGTLVGLGRLEERRCAGAASHLTGVWDAGSRARVEAAFLGTGKAYAPETFRVVASQLDRWSQSWAESRTQACRATRVLGEQSEALLDLRMACLDQQLRDLSELVRVFTAADPEVLERASSAAGSLPGPEECADRERLTSVVPPPAGVTPAAIAPVRERLARVRALRESGVYRRAADEAAQAAQQATAIGYPALQAEATFALGDALAKSGDYPGGERELQSALWLAEASRWDELAARATQRLAQVAGGNQQRFEQAAIWLDLAEAKARRLDRRPDLLGAALYARAMILQRQGLWAESRRRCEEALPLLTSAHGAQSPRVAEVRRLRGRLLLEDGRLPESKQEQEAALAIWTATLGAGHPDVAMSLTNLGHVLAASGDLDGAQRVHEQALATATAALGPTHPYVANALQNLGDVALARGDAKKAEELSMKALTLRTRAYGRWHPLVAVSLGGLADAVLASGDAREALWHQQQALEILQKAVPESHPGRAQPWAGMGEAYLALGETAKAREAFERALGLRAQHPGEPGRLARVRFGLARTLPRTPEDDARAVSLAQAALDALQALGPAAARDTTAIAAWLRDRSPAR